MADPKVSEPTKRTISVSNIPCIVPSDPQAPISVENTTVVSSREIGGNNDSVVSAISLTLSSFNSKASFFNAFLREFKSPKVIQLASMVMP